MRVLGHLVEHPHVNEKAITLCGKKIRKFPEWYRHRVPVCNKCVVILRKREFVARKRLDRAHREINALIIENDGFIQAER